MAGNASNPINFAAGGSRSGFSTEMLENGKQMGGFGLILKGFGLKKARSSIYGK